MKNEEKNINTILDEMIKELEIQHKVFNDMAKHTPIDDEFSRGWNTGRATLVGRLIDALELIKDGAEVDVTWYQIVVKGKKSRRK